MLLREEIIKEEIIKEYSNLDITEVLTRAISLEYGIESMIKMMNEQDNKMYKSVTIIKVLNGILKGSKGENK